MEKEVKEKSFTKVMREVVLPVLLAVIAIMIPAATLYVNSNQNEKDKLTDLKIEKIRIENTERSALNNRNVALIIGAMWETLHKLDADRCFVIQPHPEHRHQFMSVALEVTRPGVSYVKEIFQNVPMSDMPSFSKLIASNVWLYFDNPPNQVDDKRALSMMLIAGSMQIAIRQLTNAENKWVGSLVVENIKVRDYNESICMETVGNCADAIRFILPPIN
jgi:hypothetical protein